MTEDEKQIMRIRGGHDILRRAMKAVESGQFSDFVIYSVENNPQVIDHIKMVK